MQRHLVALALTIVVSLLALTSCGGGGSESPSFTGEPDVTVHVVVQDGSPRGGIQRATLQTGQRVRITVKSDVADEVHVHGYDFSQDVAAGGTAQILFTASIAGRFEVELENRGVQITELTVTP